MHNAAAIILFWLCAATIVYVYLLYPILVALLSRCFGRRRQPPRLTDDQLPTISLLIAAHNEEAVIEERVRNALAINYPATKLEVVVGSDGSSDRTAELVQGVGDPRVRLLDYPQRRGKASVLNSCMAQITADVVLLSDANTHMDSSAARNLARWFSDPSVGAVCGKLVLTDGRSGRNVDGLYWKYETFLKCCEGRLGALLGSNGAIYAIRRNLFLTIPPETIVDDFVIPLLMKLRTRYQIRYDREAIATEESAPSVGAEFLRRSRIGAGGFQAIGILWPLLNPFRGWVALTFFSHKVLRWLCPFAMIGALLANLALAERSPYRELFLIQLSLYLAAAVGTLVPGRSRCLKPIRLLGMFVCMNAAILVGFLRWLRGNQKGTWHRTARVMTELKPIGDDTVTAGAIEGTG
jgi:cellulose synthase/poly-beta-1,6-N-acetylglucosamine synthase-like glycosyltransferase